MGLGYGRGGLGKDIFTFALLDWRGSARQQMCVWSDPENRNCPGSLYDIQEWEGCLYTNPPPLKSKYLEQFYI